MLKTANPGEAVRLIARGLTREQVLADIDAVVAVAGSYQSAARHMCVSPTFLNAARRGEKGLGAAILDGLYGESPSSEIIVRVNHQRVQRAEPQFVDTTEEWKAAHDREVIEDKKGPLGHLHDAVRQMDDRSKAPHIPFIEVRPGVVKYSRPAPFPDSISEPALSTAETDFSTIDAARAEVEAAQSAQPDNNPGYEAIETAQREFFDTANRLRAQAERMLIDADAAREKGRSLNLALSIMREAAQ